MTCRNCAPSSIQDKMSRKFFSHGEITCLQKLIIKYKLNSPASIKTHASRKLAWSHLTEEFNKIETNSKRSEVQLKKCWDNLKTRKKATIVLEKHQCLQYTVDRCQPASLDPEQSSEPLIDQNDTKISDDLNSDNILDDPLKEEIINTPELLVSRQGENNSPSQPSLTDYSDRQTPDARNPLVPVAKEEINYSLEQERQRTELLDLKLKEQEWLVKTAEENYNKACLVKENAAVILEISKVRLRHIQNELNQN